MAQPQVVRVHAAVDLLEADRPRPDDAAREQQPVLDLGDLEVGARRGAARAGASAAPRAGERAGGGERRRGEQGRGAPI